MQRLLRLPPDMLNESLQRMAASASALGSDSFEPSIDVSIRGVEADGGGDRSSPLGRVVYMVPDRALSFESLTMRGLELQLLVMDILVRARGWAAACAAVAFKGKERSQQLA